MSRFQGSWRWRGDKALDPGGPSLYLRDVDAPDQSTLSPQLPGTFARWFADGVQPEVNFHAGLEVTELLMTCYMSAEQGRVIDWKPADLASYVPPVARRS